MHPGRGEKCLVVEKGRWRKKCSFFVPTGLIKGQGSDMRVQKPSKDTKLVVRNAENSKQVLLRLLYPEPSHIFCQKKYLLKDEKEF